MPLRPQAAPDEELARAEVYGLLATLFAAPPSAELYGRLRAAATEAPGAGALLEASFGELAAAARRLPLEAVRAEHDALFGGVGKAEVLPYASYFVAGALNEAPLVALRDELRTLGLERDPALGLTEDHIACLCEAMRCLIAGDAGDDPGVSSLGAQQRFFAVHLRGWADALWDALAAQPRSEFYRALGAFARDFFAVEGQAFDIMLDA